MKRAKNKRAKKDKPSKVSKIKSKSKKSEVKIQEIDTYRGFPMMYDDLFRL